MPKVWCLQTKVNKINWHFYFDHRTIFTIKIKGKSYKTGVGRQQNMEATKEVSKLKIKHNQETSRKLPKKASHINLAVTLQNFDY